MTDNNVTISGNVTGAPELRYSPSGQARAAFSVAVNRRWKNKAGEWDEQTSFIDCTCWGQLAENVCESIDRGTRVAVIGRLEQRSWEADDGTKRSKVEIVADDVCPSLKWATATVNKIDREPAGAKPQAAPKYDASTEPF